MERKSHRPNKIQKTLIVLGDNKVGKTSMLIQLSKGRFKEEYQSTIGADFYSKDFTLNNERITLMLWDTNGEEKKDSIIPNKFYLTANSFIIILSYEQLEPFSSFCSWLDFIKEAGKYQRNSIARNADVFVIINKRDLKEKKFDKRELEERIKTEYPFVYIFDISSRDNKGVDNLFQRICRKLLGEELDVDESMNRTASSLIFLESNRKNCPKCC